MLSSYYMIRKAFQGSQNIYEKEESNKAIDRLKKILEKRLEILQINIMNERNVLKLEE